MYNYDPANKYIKEIDSWINIVIMSVLSAAGVNLLVSGITVALNGEYFCALIITGIIFIIISLVLLFVWSIKQKKYVSITGFFMYNKTSHQLYHIPEYYISLVMWLHIHSALEEDPAISRIWKGNNIFSELKRSKENGYHMELMTTELGDLFVELLEYCVLDELSNHLTCYFSDYNNKEIMTLNRDNIPEIFLKNRFLNWLSAEKYDMEKEREIMFSDLPEDEKIKKCMELWPKGSSSYSRFEMKLPKGSEIQKEGNIIILNHRLFSLKIEPFFSGSNASLPNGFQEYYMGIDKDDANVQAYQYCLSISVNFKVRSFFSIKRRKYYLWIDRFIERLQEILSEEQFFHKIGWEKVNTIMICEKNREQKELKRNNKKIQG